MVVVFNLLKRFSINGICIFPFIFIIDGHKDTDRLINHEKIHLIQQIELGVILFYPLYIYYNVTRGYWNNPFELEAYDNEDNLLYRSNRDMYSWTKYI